MLLRLLRQHWNFPRKHLTIMTRTLSVFALSLTVASCATLSAPPARTNSAKFVTMSAASATSPDGTSRVVVVSTSRDACHDIESGVWIPATEKALVFLAVDDRAALGSTRAYGIAPPKNQAHSGPFSIASFATRSGSCFVVSDAIGGTVSLAAHPGSLGIQARVLLASSGELSVTADAPNCPALAASFLGETFLRPCGP